MFTVLFCPSHNIFLKLDLHSDDMFLRRKHLQVLFKKMKRKEEKKKDVVY